VVGGVLWQSEFLPPCEKRPASLSILLRRGSRSSRPKVTVSAHGGYTDGEKLPEAAAGGVAYREG
jgi:hypothetical protein